MFKIVIFGLLTACAAGDARSIANGASTEEQAASTDVAQAPVTTEVPAQDSSSTVQPQPPIECPLGQQPNGDIGGPSICCSGAYQVCDDFEADVTGGSPNAKFWQVEMLNKGYGNQPNAALDANTVDQNAIIEISEAMSARGKKSLHIVAQNSNQLPNNGWHHDMLVNRTIFPAPNNTFWGRAFVYYVQDANSDYPGGHSTLADASGTVTGSSTFYTWWRLSTFGNFAINCEHGDSGASSPVRMPMNRWACLEWQYRGDANNEIYLYLDGNQLAMTTKTSETADNPAGLAPVYDAFRLGWEVYSYQYNPTPKQFEMYYDEVALDYNRIGCDK
jgi:hypothetical protein